MAGRAEGQNRFGEPATGRDGERGGESIRVEAEPPVFVVDDGEAGQAGVARNNILADRMLREMLGCDDLNLASLHVGLIDDAPDAAVMVDVRVAVDNRDERLFTQTGRHELIGGLGGLGRYRLRAPGKYRPALRTIHSAC